MCSIDSKISIFADGEKYVENNFVCFTNPSDFLEIGWLRFGNVYLGPHGMRKKKTNDFYLYRGRYTAQDHTANAIDPEIEDLTIVLQ